MNKHNRKFLRRNWILISTICLLLLGAMQPAAAQEEVSGGEIEVTKTIDNPHDGDSGIESLIGPDGEKAMLHSIIGWQTFLKTSVWGTSKIEITSGSPTAKAWTTLYKGTTSLESTAGNPCFTSTVCESSTPQNKWYFYSGDTAKNYAETTVYWSNGGSTDDLLIATHTF